MHCVRICALSIRNADFLGFFVGYQEIAGCNNQIRSWIYSIYRTCKEQKKRCIRNRIVPIQMGSGLRFQEFCYPVTGIAQIIFRCPAIPACPAAADAALTEVFHRELGVAEVAKIPAETRGYFCRRLPLFPEGDYLLLHTDKQALRFRLLNRRWRIT